MHSLNVTRSGTSKQCTISCRTCVKPWSSYDTCCVWPVATCPSPLLAHHPAGRCNSQCESWQMRELMLPQTLRQVNVGLGAVGSNTWCWLRWRACRDIDPAWWVLREPVLRQRHQSCRSQVSNIAMEILSTHLSIHHLSGIGVVSK